MAIKIILLLTILTWMDSITGWHIPRDAAIIGRRRNYLQGAIGCVSAGNFTYYSVTFEGPLTMLLSTLEGDADLYASHRQIPTWDPHTYSLKSATCGEDVVYVSATLKRPVLVGVYGHPSYPRSRFTLRLYCHHQSQDGTLIEVADGNKEDTAAEDGVAICRNLPLPPCPGGSAGVACEKRRRSRPVKTETTKPKTYHNGLSLFWTVMAEMAGDVAMAVI